MDDIGVGFKLNLKADAGVQSVEVAGNPVVLA
jgi:hypothetical protein